jgi:hypothetical protein
MDLTHKTTRNRFLFYSLSQVPPLSCHKLSQDLSEETILHLPQFHEQIDTQQSFPYSSSTRKYADRTNIKTIKEASPLVINNVSRKMVLAFLLLALNLTIVMPGWGAGLTYTRDKLQGTTSSQGDYSAQPSCPAGQVKCGNTCVNLLTDSHNCSACGAVCAKGKICSGGICRDPVSTGKNKQIPPMPSSFK